VINIVQSFEVTQTRHRNIYRVAQKGTIFVRLNFIKY